MVADTGSSLSSDRNNRHVYLTVVTDDTIYIVMIDAASERFMRANGG